MGPINISVPVTVTMDDADLVILLKALKRLFAQAGRMDDYDKLMADLGLEE